ncbi:MAG: transglycosylase SLT domain-containing protein [Rubrivivax sp.]|nr:transglycosylase SLT domain-containing protein [Rubrivivax sp.]
MTAEQHKRASPLFDGQRARPLATWLRRTSLLLACALAACAQLDLRNSNDASGDGRVETTVAGSNDGAAAPKPAASAADAAPTDIARATPAAPVTSPGAPSATVAAAAASAASSPTQPASLAPPIAAEPPPEPAPRMRLDPEQDAERADLWRRLRDGMRIPDLDNDLVRRWEQHYAGQPDYVQRMVERGARYLFHIVEEIERREMPMDLALLPFIESAFDPQALSRARAAGMWQFMPGTGREFDLRQNVFRDDRLDVLASTRAALDFLGKLHERFGDWHLALAAYNWGPGNVARAVQRNRGARQPTDLSSLRGLPRETRNYVPKLQAVKNIVLRPQAFGITLAKLENHPYFLSVAIERDIDVALAARLAGLSEDEFRQLNPQHNRAVILSAGTPHVLLPYDNANEFVRALADHEGQLASWTAWVAPRTLKTADAARLVGVPEAQLAEVNQIPPRMVVRAGSALIVPRGTKVTDDVSESLADNGMLSLAPEAGGGRMTKLRAGPKGDTVAAVARRHGLTAAQVARWNNVGTRAVFAPGASILVVLPTRQRAVVAGRASARPAAKAAAKPARKAAAPARVKRATR